MDTEIGDRRQRCVMTMRSSFAIKIRWQRTTGANFFIVTNSTMTSIIRNYGKLCHSFQFSFYFLVRKCCSLSFSLSIHPFCHSSLFKLMILLCVCWNCSNVNKFRANSKKICPFYPSGCQFIGTVITAVHVEKKNDSKFCKNIINLNGFSLILFKIHSNGSEQTYTKYILMNFRLSIPNRPKSVELCSQFLVK